MSYKFNLDHTLAIADIHDMITIDINPKTRCSVTGGDLEIYGYLTFHGSYLTSELGEAPFEGRIPLDITLPYLDGASEVHPEVVSFDYRVENEESLTLSFEITLKDYNISKISKEVIVEEPRYEDAIIEPFDFATTVSTDKSATMYQESQPNVLVIEEEACEGVVEAVEKVSIPYSPLMEIKECDVRIEEIDFKEKTSTTIKEEIIPVTKEEEYRVHSEVDTNEEKFAKEKVQIEEKVIPVTKEEEYRVHSEVDNNEKRFTKEEVSIGEKVIPVTKEEEHRVHSEVDSNEEKVTKEKIQIEEEIIPITKEEEYRVHSEVDNNEEKVTKEKVQIEEVEVRVLPKITDSEAILMEELFTVKREMIVEEKTQPRGEVACDKDVLGAVVEMEAETISEDDAFLSVADSVARQFADGETTIKMIYVGHESETLGGVLERYSATLDDVWNLSELAGGVTVGDCVMLRYEKSI